jgi:tripartite-type tricarboxylate transporter receptor subunit TctC
MKTYYTTLRNLILPLALLIGSTSISAENITFVQFASPGGSTGMITDAAAAELEKNGHTVSRQFTNSCAAALQIVSRIKDSTVPVVMMTSGDTIWSDKSKALAVCPKQDSWPVELTLITSVSSTPQVMCTSASKTAKVTTATELLTSGTPVRIAAAGEIGKKYLRMLQEQNPKLKATFVPYSGAGPIRIALKTSDVDLGISTACYQLIAEDNSIGIMQSAKNELVNIPVVRVKDQNNTEIDLVLEQYVAVPPGTSASARKVLVDVFKTESIKKYVTSILQTPTKFPSETTLDRVIATEIAIGLAK